MEASVWVILSASVACEATNEAVVAENVRTVSMRARKSQAERVIVTPQKYPRIFIIKIIIYFGYNWANLSIFFSEFLDEY